MKTIDRRRCQMLIDISAMNFAVLEMTLYLDTHPDDSKAVQQRNIYVDELHTLMEEYEREFGPLTQLSPGNYPWQWIDEPWPWEVRCGGEW